MGTLTVSLILPVPVAVHDAPPAATQDQFTPVTCAAGKLSVTVAPTASAGPVLVTTMVYVVEKPGVYVATPSVLVIRKSTLMSGVSVSVAELFAMARSVTPTGGATEAVLTRLPVAEGAMAATT